MGDDQMKRIKKFFTAKPKQDFWFWAFITLLLFRYVSFTAILFIIPLQIGLIAPDTEVDYDALALDLADNFIGPMETINEAGRSMAEDNPRIALILSFGISHFIWVIWVSVFVLGMNLIRYGTSYLYRKFVLKEMTINTMGEKR